eukprot:scaffold105622_cov33-Phaeocystis_antarctica.AAC.1
MAASGAVSDAVRELRGSERREGAASGWARMERRDATGRGERAARLVRPCASSEVASGASAGCERAGAERAAQ